MLRASSLRWKFALVAVSVLLPAALITQSQETQSQQSESVAEAARKAREQKKKGEKPAVVVTNDTLKGLPEPSSPPELQNAKAWQPTAPGQATAEAAPSSGAAPADQKTDKKAEAKRLAAEVAKAKEKLAEVQKQLDLLQREFTLDRETVYSNPDYTHDTAGLAKLDSEQQQIAAKQQEVTEAKAHLAELQAQLAKVAPADTSAPSAPPQS